MPKPEPEASGSADASVAPPAGSWAAAIQERENAILTSDLEVLGMPNVPLSPILTSSKEVSARVHIQ